MNIITTMNIKKRGPKLGSKFKGTNPFLFGQVMSKLRRKRGMTQDDLAKKMGATIRMISYYEREMNNPEMETIDKIAHALGVSRDYFVKPDKLKQIEHENEPERGLQKRLELIPKLPENDRKYIIKTIDMILEKNGIKEK